MKYGLAGYPIGHSLSPELFKAAYADLEYDLIETEDFQEVMNLLHDSYAAINVTSPFKTLAFEAADHADANTKLIGAANILRKEQDGSITALNTDFDAVKTLLSDNLGSKRQHNAVLVVGCGGAGRAAATAVSSLGMKLYMANRTYGKAALFCDPIKDSEVITLSSIPKILPLVDAVVYALPTSIEESENISASDILKIEANYRNPEIGGNNYISGKKWLMIQALAGYGSMTGRKPDESRLAQTITF